MSFITEPLSRLTDWAMHSTKKHVYYFNEGSVEDRDLLGLKGSNLCEMSRLGLPVPPGIIISSEACMEHFKNHHPEALLCESLVEEYTRGIHELERKTGMFFGGFDSSKLEKTKVVGDCFPLLLSVRAGTSQPISGVLDTVLNLGMNDTSLNIIATLTSSRFANDVYRRFLQMFGNLVLGIDSSLYDKILCDARIKRGVDEDCNLTSDDLIWVVTQFKALADVPQDPWQQLQLMIHSVFHSWYSPKAQSYRDTHNYSASLGTAVVIQAMVYGNYNERSGCGIACTRNPSTGENILYGQYLSMAEGEDVVCGNNKTLPLDELRKILPGCYDNLVHFEKLLERHYRDMQTIKFTIQNGALYILDTCSGSRSARASVRIAVSMVQESLITEREALSRIDSNLMVFFLHPMIDPAISATGLSGLATRIIGQGLPKCGGAATGVITFNYDDAVVCTKRGLAVIYCCKSAKDVDYRCVEVADGILTSFGAFSSHTIDLINNLGKATIVSCNIVIDCEKTVLNCGVGFKTTMSKGEIITIDGSTGIVYSGSVPTVQAGQDQDFKTIMRWADKYKHIKVLANADCFDEVKQASQNRADGLGLVKTDFLFYSTNEMKDLSRGFLLSCDEEKRRFYLSKLLSIQQMEIEKIISLFPNKTITFSLVNSIAEEVLPCNLTESFMNDVKAIASRLGIAEAECEERVRAYQQIEEANGFQASRLSIIYPELTDMQVKAILGASQKLSKEGISCDLRIALPFICSNHEIKCIVPIIRSAANSIREETHAMADFCIGASLEVPRALVASHSISQENEIQFVSIGCDELTRLMYGFDCCSNCIVMQSYLEKHIFACNPFESIDEKAVGPMIASAITQIKAFNPKFKIAIHGEHCGDCKSVKYFDSLGVDSVSCPTSRIPVAKLAAAQAHILTMQTRDEYFKRDLWDSYGPFGLL